MKQVSLTWACLSLTFTKQKGSSSYTDFYTHLKLDSICLTFQ